MSLYLVFTAFLFFFSWNNVQPNISAFIIPVRLHNKMDEFETTAVISDCIFMFPAPSNAEPPYPLPPPHGVSCKDKPPLYVYMLHFNMQIGICYSITYGSFKSRGGLKIACQKHNFAHMHNST